MNKIMPQIIENTLKINAIYNENCLETMAKMPDNFVDLTVTSPPYDQLRDYHGYSFDFENIAKSLFRITKNDGVVVWIVGDETIKGNETASSFKQALFFKEIGFNLYDTMIYLKPPRGAVGNNKSYWQSFEYMFVLCKGSPKTINLIKDRKNKDAREGDNGTKRLKNGELQHLKRGGYGEYGRRTNVWEYRIGKGHSTDDEFAFSHPAIFPEKLAADHIFSWSNKNELVYDPFMGSGTTAKMALKLERNFIGSEIDPEYCLIAEKRIKEIQKTIF